MITTHTLRYLTLAGLGSVLATAALAQDDSYYYGGLSIGSARARIDQERISNALVGNGLTVTGFNRDERDTAYKLFGGYQFNRNFAVEAGYFDLGKFGFVSTTTPAGTLNGQIRLAGLNLDLIGSLPLTESLSAFVRLGAQHARTRDHFSGSGAVAVLNPNPRSREVNYKAGAGLQYAFGPSLLLRGEAEHYRVNDAVGNHGGVNVVSLSLVFPFGRAPTVAPRVSAAPVYMPPPAPAPVIVAAAAPPPVVVSAAPPPPRRVSFTAESLFGFDQSTIKPEGRLALDQFASETRGTRYEVIMVEGHTDRLGSAAYNQRLSTQRAEAVKAYLVASGGIEGSKVNAAGKGETMPVTQPGDCKGAKQTPKLIACLQPDRRVVIEVTGTR
nr:OmpA family protein [uncultured Roseateles sp.]